MGAYPEFFQRFQQMVEDDPYQIALQVISRDGEKEPFNRVRIAHEITAIGLYLRTRGLEPGDTVGILMENHPRWGIAFLAAQSIGARIVPFDIMHSTETLAHLVAHAECRFLISSAKLEGEFNSIQCALSEPLPALLVGCDSADHGNWDQIVEECKGPPQFPLVERDPDEVFLIVYTSGTTGNPKGVMLSQRGIYANVIQVLESVDVRPVDHILGVLPLYHMLALMANFIIPLYLGARVTYLDSIEPQRIVKAFSEEKITIFVCVPQFYYVMHRRILQQVKQQRAVRRFLFRRLLELSRFLSRRLGMNAGGFFFRSIHERFPGLRFFGVGGARFDTEVAESFVDLGFPIIQAYGLTETSAVTTIAGPGRAGLGSVGKPLNHAQLKIADPHDNGIGEVLVKGVHVMRGYWKNEKATLETLEDGWLHTGDLGRLDDQGFLHITGRAKDVIVLSSGKNIFPEEIEQAYEKEISLIKEMCVVGVADSTGGEGEEKLHAVIVPDLEHARSQHVANASDMIRYLIESVSQSIPTHKRIRSFEVWQDPLPRTPTRKVKRFEVQKMVEAKALRASEGASKPQEIQPESATEARIFKLLKETGKVASIRRDMNLELDCGFDSLERVEFFSNIQESLGIQISDEAAVQILTVQELVDAVDKRLSGEVSGEGEAGPVSWSEILQAPLDDADRAQVRRILRRRPLTEAFYFFLTRIIWLLSKIFLNFRVEGQENLPHTGPFLVCPNHLSFIDGFILAASLPFRVIQRLFFLGYSDYFGTRMMSYLGSLIKVVPVDANKYLRQALRLGAHGLKQDLILSVFPEGERSIDGNLKRFRKGPAILACQLGVPIVPVAILGTYEVWRRGSSQVRLHPVTVRFGQPLEVSAGSRDYDKVNTQLREAVAELIDSAPNR